MRLFLFVRSVDSQNFYTAYSVAHITQILSSLCTARYAFQNIMLQIAYANMDGLTFNLLNQTKILFTAVCLYLVVGNKCAASTFPLV